MEKYEFVERVISEAKRKKEQEKREKLRQQKEDINELTVTRRKRYKGMKRKRWI